MTHTPPPPAPPAIVLPAPHQASYGIVRGVAGPGSRRVVVKVDGRIVGRAHLAGRTFTVDVDLPFGVHAIRVETLDARGRRAGRTVRDVLGLPRSARPRLRADRLDPGLQRDVRRLAAAFGPTSGVHVQSLTSGAGAAWNARATLPAASTLKLAIAVAALTRLDGPPRHGSSLDARFRTMLRLSDNGAANALERTFGGSTSGGSAIVNGVMNAIGAWRTEMYGGYIVEQSIGAERVREPEGRGIPLNVVEQPSWGVGKHTTAHDLSLLFRALWLASGGLGPLRASAQGVTAAEARYLLHVLAGVRDHGKLDRLLRGRPGVGVLHKAGWIDSARHDSGLVFWRGGVFVATVMTYRGGATGVASDVLAGQVALAALRRFRG